MSDQLERYEQLVFATGHVAGALRDPDIYALFVEALKAGHLNREYIRGDSAIVGIVR